MASTKSSAKTSPGKRPAPVAVSSTAKPKRATQAKPPVKPEPIAKAKAAPRAAAAKPASPRARKPADIPAEQRRNYIEVAAYHIAERRGFAAGDPLEDWVQAEAEIDRLLAEGRLGAA